MKAAVRSCLPLFAIALIWTVEVALVQEYTLQPRFLDYVSWIGKHAVRWALAFFTASLILALFGKRVLALVFALHVLLSLTLLTYFDYFDFPLSEQVLLTQTGEGSAFTTFVLALVDPGFAAGLIALFFLKLHLLRRADPAAWQLSRKPVAVSALVGIVLAFGASWKLVPPLHAVGSWGEQALFSEAYGYLPSWALNAFHFRDEATVRDEAIASSKPVEHSRLSRTEPLPPKSRNIIIIQAESLDFSIIGKDTEAGVPITPFLRELSQKSMYYGVTPFRRYGTAGADFKMITGLSAEAARVPYKIAGYPFADVRTIARKSSEKGYKTAVLHGNYGYYYSRDKAFPQCGFDLVLFQQDMQKQGLKPEKGYILDGDCLDLSAKLLDAEKNLHFIITMTSHGPFNTHPDVCPVPYPYPEPQDILQRYANAVRYVDHSLQNYIENLPEDSLVFLYGDHASGLKYEGSEADLVPFFIYSKRQDLSQARCLLPDEALSGEVEFAEIVRLVHDYIELL